MERNQVIEITREEALKYLNVPKEEIHCFMGFIGADWNKQSVIDLINKSDRIAWADNMFEHNLAVINEGKLYNFDIKFPITK